MNEKKTYPTYFLIFPLALYTLFFILPSVMGLGLSFTNWNSMNPEIKFVGLEHFISIFTNKHYLSVISNTLLFAVITTVFKNVIGLGLALAVNVKFKTRDLLRTIYFFPVILAPLILGLVFKSIYDVDYGIVNDFLRAVGLGGIAQDWLGNMGTAMGAVIFVEIWRMSGQNMVIYVAGLGAIPTDYMEAAAIDGASSWQKFRYITIPQLMPSIRINFILNVIAGLKSFDLVFVLTNGGPARATEVMNTTIFKEYSSGRYGFFHGNGVGHVFVHNRNRIFYATCNVKGGGIKWLPIINVHDS